MTYSLAQSAISVSVLHTLYYEQSGNPEGPPVVVLHGGPGGGSLPDYRRYFNPQKWRIILFDQRGCGKSTPHAELQDNTTWDLVADIERLRSHLGLEQWVVFGGSWGSTLSLAYAQSHPERCQGLILRGIFLLRSQELNWLYQEGASYIFPDAWEEYVKPIPLEEQDNFLSAYYRRLTSDDLQVRREAAQAWSVWEASTSKLFPDLNLMEKFADDRFADAFARIECHYFINLGFFDSEDWFFQSLDRIRQIPTAIVQGRYDLVCPMKTAWEVHRAWPEAEFQVIADAGHSMAEPGIRSALIEISDRFPV
ncbi:MAG: prolyl aminopeptidase [Roseofilum sp. SBFL]|uniref:prolyl aminopeptidase n=1 Tax=unclassified Roseofilum TaxID=2620099 RepID=UPI000E80FB1C|nr:prolyl aminopeptidase [Roseofilum sp. SID3]MBP0023690.1 prolyl aminopeptidase [Roseofilum sp. SID2]MBP0036013.1 prolyl aminopeptidase [Roseofilum sp. Belize BBD 4]MBP0039724.1 prolyl aminopeptidase [Roseofilum sp. SID1]MBP0041713.1 prolyl aminopeptidase [Roseofilum sp. SBFL]HBQ98873.1 prolyl aminopeptidase [Cyanobacteria bacterium UBA11691]